MLEIYRNKVSAKNFILVDQEHHLINVSALEDSEAHERKELLENHLRFDWDFTCNI